MASQSIRSGYTFVRRSWSIWIEHDVNQGTVGHGQVIWEQGGGTNAFSIYLVESLGASLPQPLEWRSHRFSAILATMSEVARILSQIESGD